MPAFQAKVERIIAKTYQGGDIALAVVALKTEDGRRLGIGGESKASAEMMGFARSLKEGQTYTFPDVFLAYQKSREDKK